MKEDISFLRAKRGEQPVFLRGENWRKSRGESILAGGGSVCVCAGGGGGCQRGVLGKALTNGRDIMEKEKVSWGESGAW